MRGDPLIDAGGSNFQDWTLDSLGNWAGFTDQGTSQTRTHDAANEITARWIWSRRLLMQSERPVKEWARMRYFSITVILCLGSWMSGCAQSGTVGRRDSGGEMYDACRAEMHDLVDSIAAHAAHQDRLLRQVRSYKKATEPEAEDAKAGQRYLLDVLFLLRQREEVLLRSNEDLATEAKSVPWPRQKGAH